MQLGASVFHDWIDTTIRIVVGIYEDSGPRSIILISRVFLMLFLRSFIASNILFHCQLCCQFDASYPKSSDFLPTPATHLQKKIIQTILNVVI